MTRFQALSLSFLLIAACGGGDPSGDDDGDDDVVDPDASTTTAPDANDSPDAEPHCTTDTACLGETDGAVLCIGNSVVTCALVDGCLDATFTACTDPDVCVDDGTPSCESNGDGEACASAQYVGGPLIISGTDFAADYGDDQDFTGAGCVEGMTADANVEAVFAVNLAAHQRVVVSETAGLDAIFGVQRTCGDTEACVASADDDPEEVVYLADEAQTVYVYVGAYAADPDPADYSITFGFSACGDGVIDADYEECDDHGSDDHDGCSSTCQYEWGFVCDDAEPTVCAALPDLGTFGGGETITETSTDTLASGTSAVYTVTFTEPVRVTGSVTATAGDPDWYAYAELADLYTEDDTGLVETIGDGFERYFTPGTYVIEVYAYDGDVDLDGGFTLSMTTFAPTHTDLGTFAAGDTIADRVQSTGLTANATDYYTITFSTPVLVSGSLDVTTSGDMDLYWWAAGNPSFVAAADGAETFTDEALPAGTYYLQANAFDEAGAVDGYTLSLETTAP